MDTDVLQELQQVGKGYKVVEDQPGVMGGGCVM